MINNLSQFKKAIAERRMFEVVEHYVFPERKGEKRVPNIVQTNGFYSAVVLPDGTKKKDWNNGAGLWYGYEKANCYEFCGDIIKCKESHGNNIFDIRFIEEA